MRKFIDLLIYGYLFLILTLLNNMEDFAGKYNGEQIEQKLDKIKDMVGATASATGAEGLVPAPAAGKQTSFLRGDGTWQDIDVHEPGFLSDNFYDENDFRYILFNIAFNEVSTITQEQYDIIASKCEVDKSMQYLLLGSSTAYGVGDVIITKDSSENIQAVLRTGGKVEFGYMLSYNVIIDIFKDLTFTSSISQYTVHMVDNQSKDIALTISDQNGDNRIINFSTAGAGAKALMDDGEYKPLCETECVKGIIEDVNELKMLNSHDYYVAGWVDGDLAPNAVEFHGDREFANKWNVYLLDTTDNAGETTTPVGKLMRGNLLRFENGDYAPTVGITEDMRSQCDVDLYTDISASSLAYAAGLYDAVAEWEIDKGLIQSGSSPRVLYVASGQAVSHKLRPWETTETKYFIGMGRDETVYVLDNIVGDSGKVWAGLFSKPIVWDGIDVSKYPLRPTAYTPCPVVTIDNKTRCFFYAYEAGDANCRSHSGVNNTCQMFVNGRTYPRTVDMNQINNMSWSRANNADPDKPYPFAEGGFHALNAYIISQEIYYGRKDIHNVNMFGSGISSNDPCDSESAWKSNGGVRYKLSSSSTWKYLRWADSGDIKEADSYNYLYMSHIVNMEYQKEQCMESQMVASYANEISAVEGSGFDFYGSSYSYVNVQGTNGLEGMNVKVMKVMRDTFNAKNSLSQSVSWDLEAMLRMSLFGGMSLSGDIFVYSGGGYEQVGELKNNPDVNRGGNPFKLYMECDQTKWMKVTDINKANHGVFDFESVYPFMGDFDNKLNGYVKKRAPYTGWKVENGGNMITGQCCYGWSDCYWGSTIGTRTRVAARFRGSADSSHCSARYLTAHNAVSYASRHYAGSAQALLKVGAAMPQA